MSQHTFDPYPNKGRICLYVHPAREGRAMAYGKDMSKVYFGKSTMDLRMLRAKKLRALERARSFNTFFAHRDVKLLEHQIAQIDVVLESRALQQDLL